jgi:DNA-binding transcriptional LysR family regulator
METFVRVVETGSFSAAAKQLRVSVAAVSRHVAALEETLASSLIARTTRKLAITPAGLRYYEACVRVLGEVDEAQAVGRLGVAGPLRMSVPVSVGVLAGDALLGTLLGRHPGMRIDFRVEDQLVDLALENVDIAIRVGAEPPSSSELVAVPLTTWTRVVVASPAYVAAHGTPRAPADLARHEALSTARGAATDVWTLVDGATTTRVRLPTRFSSNAGHLLRQAALEGRGVTLMPEWFVAEDLRRRRLVRLLPRWTTPVSAVHALYRTSLRGQRRVKVVVDHLRQTFHDGTWRAGRRGSAIASPM